MPPALSPEETAYAKEAIRFTSSYLLENPIERFLVVKVRVLSVRQDPEPPPNLKTPFVAKLRAYYYFGFYQDAEVLWGTTGGRI